MEGCQNGDPAGSKVIKRMMSKVCRRPRMGRRNEKAKMQFPLGEKDTEGSFRREIRTGGNLP